MPLNKNTYSYFGAYKRKKVECAIVLFPHSYY